MYFCETSSQCEETLPINDEVEPCVRLQLIVYVRVSSQNGYVKGAER